MIRSIVSDVHNAVKRQRVLLAVIVIVIVALFYRTFFGVDLTDESYYFTQVIRLLKGDRLFADIWDATQTQGIPLLPFYWLYTMLFGYDGLILFGRICMLLFNIFTGIVLYGALSIPMRKESAVFIALLTVAFAPFSLLTVSYNNLQQAWGLLGTALVFNSICRPTGKKAAKWMLFAGGFAHALMVACYPATVVVLPVTLLLVFFGVYTTMKSWKAAFRTFCWYAAGMATVAGCLILYVLAFVGYRDAAYGIGQMLFSSLLSYPRVSLLDKLHDIWRSVLAAVGNRGIVAYFALVGLALYIVGQNKLTAFESYIGHRRFTCSAVIVIYGCFAIFFLFACTQYQRWLLIVIFAFLFAAVALREHTRNMFRICVAGWIIVLSLNSRLYGHSQSFLMYAVILALPLPLLLLTRTTQRKKARQLVVLLAVPSLLITLTIMFFSSGFFSNARHGLFCAGLCTLALLSTWTENDMPPLGLRVSELLPRIAQRTGTIVLPVVVSVALLGMYYSYVYRDAPVNRLRAVVSYGPGKGLFTTEEQCVLLDQMALDLRAQAVPYGKLLVLENCPYAYGISEQMTLFASSTWVASKYSRGSYSWVKDITETNMFDYMNFRNAVPDVIFYYRPTDFKCVSDPDYPLHTFIQDHYICVLERDDYWIFRLRTKA